MADVTRRGFLGGMSIATGVGLAGALGLHRLVSPDPSTGAPRAATPATGVVSAPRVSLDSVSLAGPMLVHVRDVRSGEISIMVGTQELLYRDTDLVSRLVTSAASAGKAEV